MRKLLILAAGLLILGTVALAQHSSTADKQQQPSNSAPQANRTVQSATTQSDMIADASDQPEFADDQADFGDEDQPDFSMDAMETPGMGGDGPHDGAGAWWRPMANRIRGFMMRMRGNRMGNMMQMAERLQLTDAQKAQFKKLRTDFQLASVDRRADLQKAQIRLRELMRDEKSAEADVMKGIDDVAKIKTDIAKARFSHMREMRAVLTDKQLDMLKEMRQNRMKPWSGNRSGNGPDSTHTGQNPRHGRGM